MYTAEKEAENGCNRGYTGVGFNSVFESVFLRTILDVYLRIRMGLSGARRCSSDLFLV